MPIKYLVSGTDTSDATATAGDILADATAYISTGKETGTMPNNAGNVNAASYHRDGDELHVVPEEGYTDGSDDAAVISDENFTEDNIRDGVTIFGLAGVYETLLTGDAKNGEVLAGKLYYKNDATSQQEGTMPNNSDNDVEVTDLTGTTIPAGYYNGSGTASLSAAEAAKVIASNIPTGVEILGVTGTATVLTPPTTNLVMWLDASDLSLENGAAVATWTDKSGNSNNATQTTAEIRPTYVASGIGSKPSVAFNGSSQLLDAPVALLNGLTAFEFFFVYKLGSTANDQALTYFSSTDGANARYTIRRTTTEVVASFSVDDATVGVFGNSAFAEDGIAQNTEYILSNLLNYTNGYVGFTLNPNQNLYSGAMGKTGTIPATNSMYASIGARKQASVDRYFNGQIAEMLVYNAALSAANKRILLFYLHNKYGITFQTTY